MSFSSHLIINRKQKIYPDSIVDISKPPFNVGKGGDDTAACNDALGNLSVNQMIAIPGGKTVIITSELTEPSVTGWRIEGIGGKPFIDISGMPGNDNFIAMTQRRAGIKNLFLSGTSSGVANTPDLNTSITDNADGSYTVVTTTAHAATVGGYVNIVGATPAGLNGVHEVSVDGGANTYDFLLATGVGNSTVHGMTSYYTVNGIALGNGTAVSSLSVENVRVSFCNQGLTFNNSQDSHNLLEIECVINNNDIVFEGTQCSSQRFINLQCLSSEQSIVFNQSSTNTEFIAGTYAASPFLDNTVSKNVSNLSSRAYGLTFKGGRFEVNASNRAGSFWDNFYISGNSAGFPAEQTIIDGSYFTGAAENNIHVDSYNTNASFKNLTFNVAANNADIKVSGIDIRSMHGIKESNNLRQGGTVVYDTTAPLVNVNEPYKHAGAVLTLNTTIKAVSSGAHYTCNVGATRIHPLPVATRGLNYSFEEIFGDPEVFATLNPGNATDYFRGVNPSALNTAGSIAQYHTSISPTSEAAGDAMTLDSGSAADTRVIIKCVEEGIWDYEVLYGGVTFAA